MSEIEVRRVRSKDDRDAVRSMVWEFFDAMKARYPDMTGEIDDYIVHQDLAGQLADFDAYFIPPHGECFLALEGDNPLGIVKLRPAKDGAAELNRMYVREAGRGKGVGRKLCGACIEEARALGYQTVLLDALYRHVEALPLYRSLGFVEYHAPDLFNAHDPRVIHMRLDLAEVPA
ncbi:GNAT family N-acetyltransferase [Pseudoruegeria sp. HB172150]|uniref:GNAT family N-acetyltransferase n=1 Tax=Pseudoruegeria sp. HB172150 TaxID=2721164 RepID=UPI0015576305|nr:GNAT family N-acetyltransferase [Pseudoruegeria sp. HB172150]